MRAFFSYLYETTVSRVLVLFALAFVVIGVLARVLNANMSIVTPELLWFIAVGVLLTGVLWGLNSWLRKQLTVVRGRLKRMEDEHRTGMASVAAKLDEATSDVSSTQALLRALESKCTAGLSRLESDVSSTQTLLRALESKCTAGLSRLESDVSSTQTLLRALESKCAAGLSRLEVEATARNTNYLGKFVLLASGRTQPSDLLNREEARVGGIAVMGEDPLVAYPIFQEFELFQDIPKPARRRMATNLRGLGYWGASLGLLGDVLGPSSSEKDLRALELRTHEYELFSGNFKPELELGPVKYQPMPGHILHVVGKALPKTQTGYTIRTHYTSMAQQRAGFHVSVVSQVGENETPDENRLDYVDDIAYYSLPGQDRLSRTFTGWLNDNIRELDGLVRRIRPAILHAHADFLNEVIAEAVAHKYGIPVVYEARGFWEESWLSRTSQRYGISDWSPIAERNGMPDAYKLRRSMEERSRAGADHVFTLARVMEDHIVRAGLEPDKVSIVPNAVDASDFPVVGRDARLAEELDIAEDEIVIGYISSIVEYEGIDTLLEAYRQLSKATVRRVRLIIVGDGPVLSALKEQRERDGIPGVLFAGRVPHEKVLDYYGMIDIFCVPRRPTDVCQLVTPLKPFEAFSTGRAVVLSDVGALREIAEDSGAARLFRAGDPESLAAVLLDLVDDEPSRAELARRGADWARRERSWDKNAETYAKAYDNLGVRPFDAGEFLGGFESEVDLTALREWTNEHVSSDYTSWFYSQTKFSEDDIRETGWTYSDFPPVDLSPSIEWDSVCSSNRTWAFNLHTWEFMDPVVRAYKKDGRAEQLDWVLERAVSWIEYYVEGDGAQEGSMAWYDMGLGLRSPRLTALIALALKAEVAEGVMRKLIAGAMRHQYEHSLDRSFNPRTNHGYYAAVGQTVLGKGLRPLPGMLSLGDQGAKRIYSMADSQFKDDGVHSEHSPDYHRMLSDSFKLGIEQGLIDDGAVIERIEKAGYALGWMIKPDGELLQFGDSPARGMVLKAPSYSNSEMTNFLVNRGRAGRPNDKTLEVFPDSGYAFVRSPQPKSTDDHEQSSYLAFAAAFHSRAHKHADDLNLVWSDRGREILVDGGRFGYGKLLPAKSPLRADGYYYDSPERQYVESTLAHNTVAADGLNHDRRNRKPYGSGLTECLEKNGVYELTGSVDHAFWDHERHLTLLPGRWLIIDDYVQALDGLPHDFRSWLNLPGEYDVEVAEEEIVRVSHQDWQESLWIQSLSGAELILPVTGEDAPLRGWRSVKDREMIRTWSLGFACHQEKDGRISTVLSFGSEPLSSDPRIEEEDVGL